MRKNYVETYAITLYGHHDNDGEIYFSIQASSYDAAVKWANANAESTGYLVLSVVEE